MTYRALAIILVCLSLHYGAQETRATPATGRLETRGQTHDRASLVSLSPDRAVWRSADGATIDVPTAEVVAWGRPPAWPTGPHVLLADGGVIAGRPIALDERHVLIESAALGRLELPASAFAGYRRTAASRPAPLPAGDRPRFTVELGNRDRLTATSLAIRDGRATIGWAGGTVELPLTDVQTIDANCAAGEAGPRAPRILVALDDGSRFPLSSVGSLDPNLPVALAVDGTCTTSLEGLEPAAVEPAPANGVPALALGRTLADEWPAARGHTAFTAIGIRAPARVTYRLPAPGDRFEATVAIDDSAGRPGSVIVRILADDDMGELREAFVSPIIDGGDEPLDLRVNLSGATRITLVVEPARDGEIPAPTIWLDPRAVAIE